MSHEPHPVVHLELHTRDLAAARSFYAQLFGWETEELHTESGTYQSLPLGAGLDGGIVECGAPRAGWLPYVEVDRIEETMDVANRLGARVLLAPREGPCGWRAVLATPQGGEIALWQPKPTLRSAHR